MLQDKHQVIAFTFGVDPHEEEICLAIAENYKVTENLIIHLGKIVSNMQS